MYLSYYLCKELAILLPDLFSVLKQSEKMSSQHEIESVFTKSMLFKMRMVLHTK